MEYKNCKRKLNISLQMIISFSFYYKNFKYILIINYKNLSEKNSNDTLVLKHLIFQFWKYNKNELCLFKIKILQLFIFVNFKDRIILN